MINKFSFFLPSSSLKKKDLPVTFQKKMAGYSQYSIPISVEQVTVERFGPSIRMGLPGIGNISGMRQFFDVPTYDDEVGDSETFIKDNDFILGVIAEDMQNAQREQMMPGFLKSKSKPELKSILKIGASKCMVKDKNEMIRFWANKFAEHFFYILIFVTQHIDKLEQDNKQEVSPVKQLVKQSEFLRARWLQLRDVAKQDHKGLSDVNDGMGKAERMIMNNLQLIKDSWLTKEKAEKLFKASDIPCAPSLFEHMQEELIYFDQAILHEEWSYAQELAWWCQEHSEGLDFVNCELPRLLELKGNDGKISMSSIETGFYALPFLTKVYLSNKLLSAKFKMLEQKIITISQAACAHPDPKAELPQKIVKRIFHDVINTKKRHLTSLEELIAKIPSLPLSEQDKVVVKMLLTHEKEEAEFAFERLTPCEW